MNTNKIEEYLKTCDESNVIVNSGSQLPVGNYNGKLVVVDNDIVIGFTTIKTRAGDEWRIPYIEMDLIDSEGNSYDSKKITLDDPAILRKIKGDELNNVYGAVGTQETTSAGKPFVKVAFCLNPQIKTEEE